MSLRVLRASAAAFALATLLVWAGSAAATPMPDAWITTKVKMSLLTTEGASASRVDVDTNDGRVTLHGTTRTAQARAKAEQIAKGIEGVREVRNLLQVVPASAQAEVKVADAELAKRVNAALERDKALRDSKFEVESVNAGVVVLEGKADSLSAHRRAIEIAARVAGVSRVESSILGPNQLADAEVWREGKYDAARSEASAARDVWITSEAKLRLMTNSKTPAFDINVDTNEGVVTLFGAVPTPAAKQAAAAELRSVGGVRSVRNELQIVTKANEERVAETDDVVEGMIEKRLEARPELNDAEIAVEVSKGVARLTGNVESYGDRLTAVTVTRATSGVRGVVDDLELTPPKVSAR